MDWKDSVRACAALGWMACFAGCDSDIQVASIGQADAPAALDAAVDSPPPPCTFDLDGDGEIDDRCVAGTDCDDDEPFVGERMVEQCGNAVDDDCDSVVDEPACATPPGGGCDAPTVVTASGPIDAILFPWGDTPTLSCVSNGEPTGHHILRVDLAEPRSLRLVTQWPPSDYRGAFLSHPMACGSEVGACGTTTTDERYGLGGVSTLAFARLPAGQHFFEVQTSGAPPERLSSYFVDVRIGPVLAPPANDVCAGATSVPDAYGVHTFEADFIAAEPGAVPCGPGGMGTGERDLFYSLELARPANVTVDVTERTFGRYGVAVQSGDCDAATVVQCVDDVREGVLARALGAGRHLVVVSGPSVGLATITVTIEPPTAVLPGETCADPIRLVSGTTLSDTFDGRDLDIPEVQCGLPDIGGLPLRDIVYDFVLTEPSDVEVRVEGPAIVDARMRPSVASIERVCGGLGTLPEQRCREWTDAPPSSARRTRVPALAAGRYFVIVSGERGSDVAVSFEAGPPSPPTVVTGNRDCATAVRVDPSPGRRLFTGTLDGGIQAVFRLELASATRLAINPAEGPTFTTGCSDTAPRMRWGVPLELEAGEYAFFFENTSAGPLDYELVFELGE
jgi:hypothetical protein